jgi:hypothetical protein
MCYGSINKICDCETGYLFPLCDSCESMYGGPAAYSNCSVCTHSNRLCRTTGVYYIKNVASGLYLKYNYPIPVPQVSTRTFPKLSDETKNDYMQWEIKITYYSIGRILFKISPMRQVEYILDADRGNSCERVSYWYRGKKEQGESMGHIWMVEPHYGTYGTDVYLLKSPTNQDDPVATSQFGYALVGDKNSCMNNAGITDLNPRVAILDYDNIQPNMLWRIEKVRGSY